MDAAATDHVIAIVADSLDNQRPLCHVFEKPLICDIPDIVVNDVELVSLEVRNRIRRQLIEADSQRQRCLGYAKHLGQMP